MEFIRLSREALEEQDRDRLIALIMEMNKLLAEARADVARPLDLSLGEMKQCLERETEILARLEQERRKLLAHMESFSKSRNAAQKYRARFPFPPLPVFFGSST
jgi:hypothetical protein